MALIHEIVNGVTVVKPEGRIDTVTAAQFQADLLAAIEGSPAIVIDASGINYVSSAGLRVFLVAAKTAGASGAKVSICGLNDAVSEIFVVSGFSEIIDIHATLEAAIG